MTRIGVGGGGKEENFEGPALLLAVIGGVPTKRGEGRGLAKAGSRQVLPRQYDHLCLTQNQWVINV